MLQDTYNIDYMHSIPAENGFHYEVALSGLTLKALKDNELAYKHLLLSINDNIVKIWSDSRINRNISISILDCNDYELVLLYAENNVISFCSTDKEKVETTFEDWLTLFEYSKGRLPNTTEELENYITENEAGDLLNEK